MWQMWPLGVDLPTDCTDRRTGGSPQSPAWRAVHTAPSSAGGAGRVGAEDAVREWAAPRRLPGTPW